MYTTDPQCYLFDVKETGEAMTAQFVHIMRTVLVILVVIWT